jgi:hypothetical protein
MDYGQMRLLVLGGTRFVGRAVVQAALGLEWKVTTFNRGLSGADLPGAAVLRGDRTRHGDLATLAAAGPWDAVIDTSGYVPRETLAVCERLEPVSGRYVFMSTVSVYRQWPVEPLWEDSEVLYCPPTAGPEYGEDVENGPTKCRLGVPGSMADQRRGDPLPLILGGDLGVEEEGVITPVPCHVDKAGQGAVRLTGGDPAKAVGPDLIPPSGRSPAAMRPDERYHLCVGDRPAPAVLDRLGHIPDRSVSRWRGQQACTAGLVAGAGPVSGRVRLSQGRRAPGPWEITGYHTLQFPGLERSSPCSITGGTMP